LGAVALIPGLPPATIQAPRAAGSLSARKPALAALVLVFGVIAAAIAAAFTFVPLLPVGSTPVLLILFGAGFAAGRLLGGHLLDRDRAPTVLVLRLLIGIVIGLALLGISHFAAAAAGAAASGVCIGCLCTVTLVMMLDRSGRHGVARGAVIWNITFDVGQAFGAVALGGVASLLGAGGMFLAAAGSVAFVAVPAAAFDWRHVRLGVPAPV
jgi:predicted MFS family arabinose efflux permease